MESNGMFVDGDCTIKHDGISYTSGGAFIAKNTKTGKLGGYVYGQWKGLLSYTSTGTVSNWDGTIKIHAVYGEEYCGNMGDKRRNVRFSYGGKNFSGMWCGIDNNQLIRVREVK